MEVFSGTARPRDGVARAGDVLIERGALTQEECAHAINKTPCASGVSRYRIVGSSAA